MFNSVQYVRELARSRQIAISQLERDCGFSNGYLNPRKLTKLPYDRAVTIAAYLSVDVAEILEDPENKKADAPESTRTVTHEDIKFALFGGDGEITDEMYEEVRRFAAFVKQREAEKKE